MDIAYGLPFVGFMNIYAWDYSDLTDTEIIVVTADANQNPGETRFDLVKKNIGIFKSIFPEIAKIGFKGILLVVANPIDILTYTTIMLSGLPGNHVFGSATTLDTARPKYGIAKHLDVDSRRVHEYFISEYSDFKLPAWASANVFGIPLHDFCKFRGHFNHEEAIHEIANCVKIAPMKL